MRKYLLIIKFIYGFIILAGSGIEVAAQSDILVPGQICAGTEYQFYYLGCPGTDLNSITWRVSGNTNATIRKINSTMAGITWHSGSTTHTRVEAYCNYDPTKTGSTPAPGFIVSAKSGSASVTLNGPTTICSGHEVTYEASSTNGGSSPNYTWEVNNSVRQQGPNRFFKISTLKKDDVVKVTLGSSNACLLQTTDSKSLTISTVTQPANVTLLINDPGPLCFTELSNFEFRVTNQSNQGSSPQYIWFRNNSEVDDNQASGSVYRPRNTLQPGETIRCRLVSSISCAAPKPALSNEVTIVQRSSTVPSVSINHPSPVCEGDEVTFSATSPQNITSYSWRIGGSAPLGNQPTFKTSVLKPGDIVYLTVGVSGSCLTGNSASTNTSSTLTITPAPVATLSPSGTLKICSTCSQTLTASAPPSGVQYTYEWFRNEGTLNLPSNTRIYTASQEGIYRVDVSRNGCKKPSSTLILSKNIRPVANAGVDKFINLPTNSLVLNGSGTDADGTITAYQWTKVSGPAVNMANATTANLSISGLTSGIYVFQLIVTDNFPEASLPSQVRVTVSLPPNNYNWIKETTVLVKDIKSGGAVDNLQIGNSAKGVNWTYFDGLGRPMQSIGVQASPNTNDLVQPIIYDQLGRENKKFLPFTANNVRDGWYKENIINANHDAYTGIAASFYATGTNNKVTGDTRPYAETDFEPSPLNRPQKEFGPGQSWKQGGKAIEHGYLTNEYGTGAGQERVIAWTINASGMPIRHKIAALNNSTGYYGSNALFVKSTRDEHGKETREYSNKQGQVILKKVQLTDSVPTLDNRSHWMQTYYIYDGFGNLRFVLQPELVFKVMNDNNYNPSADDLNLLAFQYKYDARQRMAEKKVPGADWVYMVYDNRDRLVLTQDGNQRNKTNKEWSFTKYDQLNRPILTGIHDTTALLTQVQMQGVVNTHINKNTDRRYGEVLIGTASGNIHNYSNRGYPKVKSANSCFSITYYDNYGFLSYTGWDVENRSYGFVAEIGVAEGMKSGLVTGLATGGKVKVLDGSNRWLNSVSYYDNKYRLIQSIHENNAGGTDRITTLYNFPGWVKQTLHTHTGPKAITVHRKYEHDHAGRITSITHNVDQKGDILLASFDYNELGELVDKKLHVSGSTGLQSIDYRYNIRGWLTHINNSKLTSDNGLTNDDTNDFFGMELIYNGTMGDFPMTAYSPFQIPYPFDFHNPSSVMLASNESQHSPKAWASINRPAKSTTEDLIREANERIEAHLRENKSIASEFKVAKDENILEAFDGDALIELFQQTEAESTSAFSFTPIRLNAGGTSYSGSGQSYIADAHFSGGKSYTNANVSNISGTSDPTLYLTERSATTNLGSFSYAIPVPNGSYKVRLHFAEIYWGATGGGSGGINRRVFSVSIEGTTVLQNFDIWKEVGAMAATVREFDILNVNDGFIDIGFTASVDQPKVSAIEIIPIITETIPAVPDNFTATAAGTSSINLSWASVANATSYVLESSLTTGFDFTVLATLQANATSYSHTGLQANTTYYYKLKAVNGAGSSDYTSEKEAKTGILSSCTNISPLPCTETVVNLPYSLNFTGAEGGLKDRTNATGTGFTIAIPPSAPLDPPTNPNVPGYEPSLLEISSGRLRITTTAGIMSVNPATSTNTNSQVNALGVGVRAHNRPITIETTVVNPAAATNQFEQAGLYFGLDEDNYIKLVVLASSSGRARIQLNREINAVSPGNEEVNSAIMTLSSSTVRLRLVIDPATHTAEAFYRIDTGAEIRLGSYTIPASFTQGITLGSQPNVSFAGIFATHRRATSSLVYEFDDFNITTPLSVPAAPSNLAGIAASGTAISLSWDNNAVDVDNNIVERATALNGPYAAIATLPANANTYNDTGLAAGTYHYQVKAINTAGEAISNRVSIVISSGGAAPAAPTNLLVSTGGTNSLKLEWKDNATNETGYVVERLNGTNWQVVANLPANATSYTLTGLPVGTTIQVRVKAVNGATGSAYAQASGDTSGHVPGEFTFEPQFNGNIAGVKWANSGGSSQNREKAYVYRYDAANRLTRSSYAVRNPGGGQFDRGGFNENLTYDYNGNILSLKRSGLAPVATLIDDLDMKKEYYRGNQLMRVEDLSNNHAGFKNGNAGSNDYDYDKNGNMIFDKNKGITNIKYNHLNLPEEVTLEGGRKIEYIYNAAGTKLGQRVTEPGKPVKETWYVGEIIYENELNQPKELVLIHHEEGRIVPDAITAGAYEYQYHIKDHLGNVRVTFTSKPKTHTYTVNYENSQAMPDDIALFAETGNIIANNLFDKTDAGATYTKSQRLTGANGARIGSVIAIPVGAGDKVSAEVYAKYVAATNTNNPGGSIAPLLLAALTGTPGATIVDGSSGAITTGYGNSSLITNAAYNYSYDATAPMAFINLLFIPERAQSSIDKAHFAFKQINKGAQQIGTTTSAAHDLMQINNFEAKENGYVIIYLSNESAKLTEVYFDELKITLNENRIIQTDDYYPFGLTFNGFRRVTDRENRFLYNEKELQEETNWYDYGARMYDMELGRWFAVDPLADEYFSYSSYNYVLNNPIINFDPDGQVVGTIIGAVIGGVSAAIKGESVWKGALSGAVAGAVVDLAVGAIIASGGTATPLVLAGAGALGGMAGEMTHQALYGYSDTGDVLKAGAFGFALGGVLGVASSRIASTFSKGTPLFEVGPPQTVQHGNRVVQSADDAINAMEQSAATPRVKTPKQLRTEWEEIHSKSWPKDPKTGKNKVAHHRRPLADGGEDHGRNIDPLTGNEHTQLHKQRGDFKRWGSRRRKN